MFEQRSKPVYVVSFLQYFLIIIKSSSSLSLPFFISGGQYDHTSVDDSQTSIISSAFTHMRTVSSLSLHYKVSAKYNEETRKVTSSREKRIWIIGIGFGG